MLYAEKINAIFGLKKVYFGGDNYSKAYHLSGLFRIFLQQGVNAGNYSIYVCICKFRKFEIFCTG